MYVRVYDLKLGLLNTSIITAPGIYEMDQISLSEARRMITEYGVDGLDSAIGHVSTAAVMSTLLGVDIPVNRQEFKQAEHQSALVFKLNGRPPEGAILTAEEIEAIGYSFYELHRHPNSAAAAIWHG